MIPPLSRFTPFAILGGLALVWPLTEGCSRSTHTSTLHGGAPALLREDAPLHSRGGTNPNAPYVVAGTSPQLVKRAETANAASINSCDGGHLAVTEIAAAMNGNYRALKLAFVNQSGAPCSLGGYPAISLLNKDGSPVASVVVDRVTASVLSAQLEQSSVQSSVQPAATQTDAAVVLTPKGEAWFQIGWSTGENCPTVSHISVAAPGATETLSVNHPLTVCEGRVQITTLHSDRDAN